MWRRYNANPDGVRGIDCTVRAICTVLDKSWEEVYVALCVQGFLMHDMPSSNGVWSAYLYGQGWRRVPFSEECPACLTVRDFCRGHPRGRYVMAISGHVVAVIDGEYYDTWDSGEEIPVFCWGNKEE